MCPTRISKCGVCDEEQSKYKCPACLIKYCSLACFKRHKDEKSEVNCEKVKAGSTGEPVKVAEPVQRTPREELTEDQVPIELLLKLRDSTGLAEKLGNPHLRDILLNLNKSQTPSEDIKRLMKEPLFEEFVDECLKVVEPMDNDST